MEESIIEEQEENGRRYVERRGIRDRKMKKGRVVEESYMEVEEVNF